MAFYYHLNQQKKRNYFSYLTEFVTNEKKVDKRPLNFNRMNVTSLGGFIYDFCSSSYLYVERLHKF